MKIRDITVYFNDSDSEYIENVEIIEESGEFVYVLMSDGNAFMANKNAVKYIKIYDREEEWKRI